RSFQAVHPHACGEHRSPIEPRYAPAGSSPRMWGTHQTAVAWMGRVRFIPTHVGNTIAKRLHPICMTVHPHACGEHALEHDLTSTRAASSPRMWGTHELRAGHRPVGRFIPTHVGNTIIKLIASLIPYGSSPRMWGTPCRWSGRP